MPPKGKFLRLVEQLAPTLPKVAGDALRAAARGRLAEPEAGTGASWPCLAPPAAMPDWASLMGRVGKARAGRSTPAPEAGGTFSARSAHTAFGPAPYKLFVPTSVRRPAALVVMLHGCTQSPDDFAAGTRMNALAQSHGLLVAYPEQGRTANMSRCWNWFLPQNQGRDHGEAAMIAAITRDVMAAHGVQPGRVAVAGLSAGGAMAAIMAESYPEIFAAVGIHSGLPAGAAHDIASAFTAMRQGGTGSAPEAGALAKGVPTIVFHGDADTTVHPGNAAAIVARLQAREHGLQPRTETGRIPDGHAFSRTVGQTPGGQIRFESWTVAGAGHAWSGGSSAGSYTDPAGPDASAEILRFFLAQLETANPGAVRVPAATA